MTSKALVVGPLRKKNFLKTFLFPIDNNTYFYINNTSFTDFTILLNDVVGRQGRSIIACCNIWQKIWRFFSTILGRIGPDSYYLLPIYLFCGFP